jgi:hypothetical protein
MSTRAPIVVLDDYKLDTTFNRTYVTHKTDGRSESEQRWSFGRQIGFGTFGNVFLQEETLSKLASSKKPELRAVKEISKFKIEKYEIEYMRELEALMKFHKSRYDIFLSHVFRKSWKEI